MKPIAFTYLNGLINTKLQEFQFEYERFDETLKLEYWTKVVNDSFGYKLIILKRKEHITDFYLEPLNTYFRKIEQIQVLNNALIQLNSYIVLLNKMIEEYNNND